MVRVPGPQESQESRQIFCISILTQELGRKLGIYVNISFIIDRLTTFPILSFLFYLFGVDTPSLTQE